MKRELRLLDAEVLQLERAASEAQAALRHLEEELRAAGLTHEQAAAQHVNRKNSPWRRRCNAIRRAATWCGSAWN